VGDIILAFHHDTFANSGDPYGDGTLAGASANNHVFADTQTGTYDWGTLSGNALTSTETTYTWTPPNEIESADVLMVAGGGGGGGFSGGGGAGGLLFNEGETLSGQKTIVIGNGGVGGIGYENGEEEVGTSGYNTSFTGLTTTIGGGGGGGYNYDGLTGGSGGGAGFITQIGGSGTSGQGYAGGNSSGESTGGGGGAGGVGENGTDKDHSGDGGLGVDYTGVFGTMYGDGGWFASGGGGGCRLDQNADMTIGTASQGGGTDGTNTSTKAQDAQKHTGGGGGGGGYNESTTSILGGTGGSGIVLVKFENFTGKTIPKVTGASFDSTNVTFTVQGSMSDIKYTINGGSEQTTPVGTLAVAHGLSASASITVVAYAVDANGDQIGTKKTVTGTIP